MNIQIYIECDELYRNQMIILLQTLILHEPNCKSANKNHVFYFCPPLCGEGAREREKTYVK